MCVLSYVKKLDMINKADVSINENIDIEYLQMISSINNNKFNSSDLIIITSIIISTCIVIIMMTTTMIKS